MLFEANLLPLRRADGSATFSRNGYSIIAAANGPVEAQRRDELPEEAVIEVIVRPAVGVGGVRERHFESIIHKTLRHVILVAAHPKTLIQVTLQVTATPEDDITVGKLPQAASDLPCLPALLQAAILALLSTSVPLKTTFTSTLVAVTPKDELLCEPTPQQLQTATSVHVLAFSSQGRMLVAESEGAFSMDMWELVVAKADKVCRGSSEPTTDGQDIDMEVTGSGGLESSVRDTVARTIAVDQRWKENKS